MNKNEVRRAGTMVTKPMIKVNYFIFKAKRTAKEGS